MTTALLGAVALTHLTVVSSTQISARVPWSIEPGTHDLTLTNEAGQSGSLAAAATVSTAPPGWISIGPFGGNLDNLALDPVNPAHLFVSAERSGVYSPPTAAPTGACR